MKTYEVVAHQGVSPIRIGMSRAASRAAMNLPFTSSVRHAGQPKVDFYHENAFQVFFDVNDEVEYVELSRSDLHAALYRGVNAPETDAEQLLAHLCEEAAFDENNWEFGYSSVFPALELSVWRPVLPEDKDDSDEGRYFATIGVGKRGYDSDRISSG